MSRAQDRLQPLVDWVKTSSASEQAPLSGTIHRGPWAVFVPQSLSLSPTPTFTEGHLPLWIPESQVVPGLPPFTQPAPQNQDDVDHRLRHLIWMVEEGRFEVALLVLTDPAESLASALARQMPDLDLALTPAVFLPCWLLDEEHRAFVAGKLPMVRG